MPNKGSRNVDASSKLIQCQTEVNQECEEEIDDTGNDQFMGLSSETVQTAFEKKEPKSENVQVINDYIPIIKDE